MVPLNRGSLAGIPDLAMAQQPGICLWPVLLCISLDPFPPAACIAFIALASFTAALFFLTGPQASAAAQAYLPSSFITIWGQYALVA